MYAQNDPALVSRFQVFSRWAGIAAASVGVLVLAGWFFNIPTLTTILPGLVSMKANTALCFILTGSGLALIQRRPQMLMVMVFGGLVALVGLLTLAEYAFDWNPGLDQLLVRDTVTVENPGRMSPVTAFNFSALGIAVMLLAGGRGLRVVQALALAAAFLGLLSLIGYLYGVQSLYQISTFSSIALHTALTFVVLGLGVFLSRPDEGLAGIFTSASAGGQLARGMIPAAVLVPIVLGWLRLRGQLAGMYDTRFGLALFALSNIVTFSVLIGALAGRLRRIDVERAAAVDRLRESNETLEKRVIERTSRLTEANKALKASEALYRLLADNSSDLIARYALDGVFLYASPASEFLLGYKPEAIVGRSIYDLFHPDELAYVGAGHQAILDGRETRTIEYRLRRADGTYVWVESTARAVRDESGKAVAITATTRDISRRKESEAVIYSMNESLARQTAELATANAELEAYGHTIAHDLKGPLGTIRGFASLLPGLDPSRPENRQEALEAIDREVVRMAGMIDSLLLLANVRHGEEPIESVAVGPVIQAALERFKQAIAERGFTVQTPEVAQNVMGYGPWIEEVFANLIGNAIKYMDKARAEPRITIRSIPQAEMVRFEVEDNGLGIKPEHHAGLFQMFSRFHSGHASGSGLGLSIVARIVTRLGGQIGVESEPGRGSTFWFTLPAADTRAKRRSPKRAQRSP